MTNSLYFPRSWIWSVADIITPHPDYVKYKAQNKGNSAMAGLSFEILCHFQGDRTVYCTGVDLGVIHLKDSLMSHWASPLNHLFGVQMGYSHFSEVLKSKTILTVGMGRCSEDFQGAHAKYSHFPSQSNYPKNIFKVLQKKGKWPGSS